MAKPTFKSLRCENCKMFQLCWTISNTMNVRVNNQRSCHIKSFFHHIDKSNLREISQTGPIPEIK